MGASQSSTSSGAGGGRPTTKDGVDVQDYYGLLELPDPETSTSSSEEIRRAYRKLALRYHPDKNPDDVEAANKRFHLIQAAYEILSDEQEKAWYDAHREQILRGSLDEDEGEERMDEDLFQSFKNGSREPPSAPKGSSLPGLTPRQLMRFLDASLCIDTKPPSADESGFFGTFRRLFERLSEEEKGASPYPGEKAGDWEAMPSFGYSHTPYLHPKDDPKPLHQDQVRDFYTAWSSFYSRKSFGWKDGYRLHDAPDRRMRRAMEKENKRLREEARREYNDIVRSLVGFIRKRDPRFKAHTAMQSSSANGAEDMERRRQAAEQERREQEERAKSFRQQKWDAWDDKQANDSEYDSEASFGERVINNAEGQTDQLSDGSLDENAMQNEMLECFVCDKVFQSEAAFINHENSNKHKKQVQQIKRQMKKEDKEIREQFDEKLVVDEAVDEPGMSKKARQRLKKRLKEQEKAATSTAETSDTESTAAKETLPALVDTAASNAASEQAETPPATTGKGRRSKKDKKAASAKERCNVCSAGFESRSKLFAHVRETSHFLAPQSANERR